MQDVNDMELVRHFAHHKSEAAFSELVRRHINLVYSVAVRLTGDAEAHDVTQAVFLIFAKKAAKLSERTVLTGWFYETTRFTASGFLRAQSRRRSREQEAYMQSTLNESDDEGVWRQLAPHLETVMSGLGETDRTLLALRFYENKSAAQAAALMNIKENAAHKRTARALEKLRKLFSKRGVFSTAAIIGAAISGNSVQAAPIGLAGTVTATAVHGAAVSSSTLTLVKGAIKLMAWSKMKVAVGVGIAALVIGGAATKVAISQTEKGSDAFAQKIAKESVATYAALTSYSDSGTVVTEEAAGTKSDTVFNIRLQRPNLYHVDWANSGGAYKATGATWSDGTGNYFQMGGAKQQPPPEPKKMQNMQSAIGAASGVSMQASSTVPSVFFNEGWGNELSVAARGGSQLTRDADEKVGDVDCYVFTSTIDPSKLKLPKGEMSKRFESQKISTQLFIGKADHLIHCSRTSMTMSADALAIKLTDENIATILKAQNKPVTPENIAAQRSEMDKMMAKTRAALASGKLVMTQTHENIQVNQTFAPADFK